MFSHRTLHRNSYKQSQTVLTLTRHHILWCLNWIYTVCLCPENGFLKRVNQTGPHKHGDRDLYCLPLSSVVT